MKIRLTHVKPCGQPCTAKENIAALSENPNGWMTRHEINLCREFTGSESEGEDLLTELESSCTRAYAFWEQCQ